MFWKEPSALAKSIADNMRIDPDAWEQRGNCVRHDSGLEVRANYLNTTRIVHPSGAELNSCAADRRLLWTTTQEMLAHKCRELIIPAAEDPEEDGA